MDFNEIKDLLTDKFGPAVITNVETNGLQPALQIDPELIVQVCEELRDNNNTWFDFLSCLSAVDHGLEKNQFEVVYHLASIPHKKQLVLKTTKYHDRNIGTLPNFHSVSEVWRTAEWHEREAFDLFGIYFEGNPDLRRILLPDDWEGYPLRKDYIAAEEYKGIKIN
ncbi:MAG: NADH-quinone oxidoreductase subunit C [Daejeonella sp.]|uniref:NADH-quinone oxidoreductase subunit C n=1 Tax=Daejeonella sp. TaxID=2805397 RepID=UPI002733FFAD|nr:NADH-quinone oxidoreductase subunit C [Daejeonella sp.]MDP3468122.1 NADH-quinone oxidoreductase subunit C [Daejeonella sp.]